MEILEDYANLTGDGSVDLRFAAFRILRFRGGRHGMMGRTVGRSGGAGAVVAQRLHCSAVIITARPVPVEDRLSAGSRRGLRRFGCPTTG